MAFAALAAVIAWAAPAGAEPSAVSVAAAMVSVLAVTARYRRKVLIAQRR
jgi:hypothetical protein